MSINHVILGILQQEEKSGYDLKKIIQNTPFMYWSGNNNQIYKAFVELLENGYVIKRTEHQENAPTKHIYEITEDGREEFKKWFSVETNAPEYKKQILIKLSLADNMSEQSILDCINEYERIIRMEKLLSERSLKSSYFSEREQKFIGLIGENIDGYYNNELDWIKKVREFISNDEGESHVNGVIKESGLKKYKEIVISGSAFKDSKMILDYIFGFGEGETENILIHCDTLDDEFVKLKTGVAGDILQKLSNYKHKMVVVVRNVDNFNKRFNELLSESARSNVFMVFTDYDEAVAWL